MNNLDYSFNIFGSWQCLVNTPFGTEKYILNINSLGTLKDLDGYDYLLGTIVHEKGSSVIKDAIFKKNKLFCSTEVDFPIKAKITIEAEIIEENKLSGSIKIDEYLKTSFVGEKNVSL